VLGAVVALSLLVTLMMPPAYRSTATLQIDRDALQVMQVAGMNVEGAAPDFLQTQYELLTSRALAERVANELQLDGDTLERLGSATWWQRATSALRSGNGDEAAAGTEADELDELRQAVGLVQNGLVVEPVR